MNRPPATQLALDLPPGSSPSLENFVPGANHEALAALRRLADGERDGRMIHLWGPAASGKSHLLQALHDHARGRARLLDPRSCAEDFSSTPATAPPDLWLVDDCQGFDDAHQQLLFRLINQIRTEPGQALVTAADAPPLGLALREDLRTRLGWGLVLGLTPLRDDDKALALQTLASERGVIMSAEVVPYLLTHTARDMRQLIGLFDSLDRLALQQQRAITVPLVRELLQRNSATPARPQGSDPPAETTDPDGRRHR